MWSIFFQHIEMNLILFIVLLNLSHQTWCKTQKSFEIMRFESCSNYKEKDLPMQLTRGRRLGHNYNNRSLELTMVIKETIGGRIEGTINLWKCDLTGSQSSCEYYVKDLKVKKICEKIPMKDQLWSPFTQNISPQLDCPMKPDTYHVNCPFSNDIFRFMPVPTGIWKARGLLFSDNNTVLCIDFDSRVLERKV
ncbi:uncharacterized protein LOC123314270 [Coccinella septempunctata]|uniref:uncharacterized protein LOC123314270 n=1 Tax=Coccinella septempunctata TaxID=41139 RepID=UPI001D07AF33|nr:uncharacterized protein LOC123314270 [Coccinella septempunctata]